MHRRSFRLSIRGAAWASVLAATLPTVCAEEAASLGLTEPFRTIDVAAVESGVIETLRVQEGDSVTVGQELARLNSDALEALLKVSEHSMESDGQLLAAQAELELQQERTKNFTEVFARGHARPEEVRRAQADLAIAQARVKEAEEELTRRRLEYQRVKTQLDLRVVRAPLAGVVAEVHREVGEYVSPNAPAVVTIVQLNPLLAVFSLPASQATSLAVGQQVRLTVDNWEGPVTASVDFIAPVADPESGTVLVKMRVPNPSGKLRSGARCVFDRNDLVDDRSPNGQSTTGSATHIVNP